MQNLSKEGVKMVELIHFIGGPGSGKTYAAKEWANGDENRIIIEDPQENENPEYNSAWFIEAADLLHEGFDVAVTLRPEQKTFESYPGHKIADEIKHVWLDKF